MNSVSEASLSRVWQHVNSDQPSAMITAFRDEYSPDENVRRNIQLAMTVRELGYGFFYVDGFWIENQGTVREVRVSEVTVFVIGNEGDDAKFRKQMIELGVKYNQDGVLVKDNEGAKVYDQSGGVMFDVGQLKPGNAGEIYTKLRNNKNSNTFVFEAERDNLGFISRLGKQA